MRVLYRCIAAMAVAICYGCGPNNVESASAPLPVKFTEKRALPAKDVTVHLVPIGRMPKEECARLAADLAKRIPIKFDVLPSVSAPLSAWEQTRRQYAADGLVVGIMQKYRKFDGDQKAFVIGLTIEDIYSRSENLRYIFATNVGNFAVVSTARMNPLAYGRPLNPELLRTRMRKMVLKRIGLTVYGFNANSDPRSVMFSPIGGLDDLDRMGEDFLVSDVPVAPDSSRKYGNSVHVFSKEEQAQARELIRRIEKGENPKFGGH